jgi:ABC-type spermidine/putrescine transport system permease subunit II
MGGDPRVTFRRHPVAGVASVIVIALLWVPLIIVSLNAINKDTLLVGWGGATLRWFSQAFHDPEVREGLRLTMIVGGLSTLIAVPLAVTGALWWRRASRPGQRLYEVLIYVNVILPEVVFASALFLLFVRAGVPLGVPSIVIGHSVWNAAYAFLIVQARLGALDPTLEEAAADLGANGRSVFWRVTVPALIPGIVVAALIAFTFSFDDVITTYFLAGSSGNTLPVVLFGLIRFRVTPEVNAIGVLVMVFTAGVATLGYLLLARVNRGRSAGRAGTLPGV